MSMIETALGTAITIATKHISNAINIKDRAKKYNIRVCVEYIRAAQAAIKGMEEEVDEILVQCKYAANFDWGNKARLYERIELYINRYRLCPILKDSIEGIDACKQYAAKDTSGFWGKKIKKNAVNELSKLLDSLLSYLNSLSNIWNYDESNFIGPSGVNLNELLDIQKLILNSDEEIDEKTRKKIIDVVNQAQQKRVRKGLMIAAKANKSIQDLIVGFQLTEG